MGSWGGSAQIGCGAYLGWDDDDDDSVGVVLTRESRNTHPDPRTFRPAAIYTSTMPAWCVPGHDCDTAGCDGEGYFHPAAWYSIATAVQAEGEDQPWIRTDVLLDENAARSLRDDLTRWLDLPKTLPSEVG